MIVYFLIIMLISIIVQKKATSGYMSFLIAGKSMPWYIVAFSAFATYEGATSFLAWPGQVWKSGAVIGWQIYATSIGVLLFTLLMVPILANMKKITLAEPFEERYGPGARLIVAILSYSRLLGGGAIMLLGIADILQSYFGISLALGLFISVMFMSTYVLMSGQFGVMYADIFQAMFTLVSSFGAPIIFLLTVGKGSLGNGWHMMLTKVPSSHLDMFGGGKVGSTIVFGYIATWFFSQMLRPDLYGRIFSARTSRDGVLGWIAFATLAPIQQTGIILTGLVSTLLVTHLKSPDMLMPTLLGHFAPLWFAVVYNVGVLSACTAVAAASFLGAASIYTNDIHLRYINPWLPEKQSIWYTRVAVLVFALVSASWAYFDNSIITIISNALNVLIGGVLVSFFAMFFSKRMTTVGAYVSMISGGITSIIFVFILPKVHPFHMPGVIFSILISLIGAFVGSLLSRPEYEKARVFSNSLGLRMFSRGTTTNVTE
jgi:Na+/proline symporter